MMMNLDNEYKKKRLALARVAGDEGCLALAGDENLAGEAIGKYLRLDRF